MRLASDINVIYLYPNSTSQKTGMRLTKKRTAIPLFTKYTKRGFRLMAQVAAERGDQMYNMMKISDPTVTAMPQFLGPLDSFLNVSWVLPFQGTNKPVCTPGLWFHEVDEFGE